MAIPQTIEADIRYKTAQGSRFFRLTPRRIYEYKDGKLSLYARQGGKHPYITKIIIAYNKAEMARLRVKIWILEGIQ
jgi:hypothetical protein